MLLCSQLRPSRKAAGETVANVTETKKGERGIIASKKSMHSHLSKWLVGLNLEVDMVVIHGERRVHRVGRVDHRA